MAPTEKKVEKTWKCGKCSQVLQQKQSLSRHKRKTVVPHVMTANQPSCAQHQSR